MPESGKLKVYCGHTTFNPKITLFLFGASKNVIQASAFYLIICLVAHSDKNLQYCSRTTFQWEYSGIFWNILEYFGIFMEYSKILPDIMEYFRSLLFHFILEYSRIFQNVTKYSRVYSKIFENIWEYSRIFWNNWKFVPPRYCM